jgi:outer membrane protein OmpA-like peptidoglycan-associated protein/tetratricopeptide (TPR) repeat protein
MQIRSIIYSIKFLVYLLVIIQISSCTSYEKIRTGSLAMERKQYAVAQQLLLNEIYEVRGLEKANKTYLLGEAYRMTNQPEEALKWYLKTIDHGLENDEVYWWTGMMFKQTGQYNQAIEYFSKIDENRLIGIDANRESEICRQAIIWNDRKSPNLEANPISLTLNGSVFLNGIYEDGRLIVTSDHDPRKSSYKWTGRFFSEPSLLNQQTGEFSPVPEIVNNQDQWGYITFNSDYTEMIYTLCSDQQADESFCRLCGRNKINDEWSAANELPFINPEVNYSHPFLTRDSVLFFSANDMNGKGGYDIYYSIKTTGKWQDPVNLPSPINTPGNEKFPTINNDTLYFSSDYLPGLGGLDIFKTYIRPNGQWSPPQNMMPPLNSSKDDFGIIMVAAPLKSGDVLAYFNSSRNGKNGFDQIFSVTRKRTIDNQLIASSDSVKTEQPVKQFKRFLAIRVLEQVFENPEDPNSRVIGKKPVGSVSGFIDENSRSFTTKNDGRFITEIEFDASYSIKISKEGFLNKLITVPTLSKPTTDDADEIQTTFIEIFLQKPYIDQEVVLQNIYYDLDKWFIREDAKPVLTQLAGDLIENPGYNVLIASHTDCRADEAYNLELSEKRAQAVVDYLVSKGIDKNRLSYIGYGKSRLIEECPCESCTESQHQKNRRTTFTLSNANQK